MTDRQRNYNRWELLALLLWLIICKCSPTDRGVSNEFSRLIANRMPNLHRLSCLHGTAACHFIIWPARLADLAVP
jgi:hypothetical protein